MSVKPKVRLATFVLFVIISGRASAQSAANEWDYCGGSDQPVRIESCSAIIASSKQNDDTARAHLVRGSTYLTNGEFDRAIADFTETLNLHSTDKDLTKSAILGRGIAYIYKIQPDQAITDLAEAIRLDPANGTALQSMGNAYALKADYANAVVFYNKALKLAPNAVGISNRAYALLKLKRYREARADYDLALKGDDAPKAKSLFGRGLAEKGLGDATDAARDMAAAKQIDPDIAKAFE